MEISSRSFSDIIKQEQSGTSDGEEVYICWNGDNSGHEDETNLVLWRLVIECFTWYLKAGLISIAIFLETGWKERIIDEEVGSCILWTICVAKASAFLRSWRISRIYTVFEWQLCAKWMYSAIKSSKILLSTCMRLFPKLMYFNITFYLVNFREGGCAFNWPNKRLKKNTKCLLKNEKENYCLYKSFKRVGSDHRHD